jgi:hypothetical protein
VLRAAGLTPVYKCLLFNELYFLVSVLPRRRRDDGEDEKAFI